MSRANNKAQALVEMAIFGSFILICFGALLSYGQRLNEEQAVTMDAFRLALQRAAQDNGFVSFTVMKNKGLVNLYNFFNPQSGSFSADATVLWAKGEPAQKSYYLINDDEIEIDEVSGKKELNGEEADLVKDVPVEVWDVRTKQETDYSESSAKLEDEEGITNLQEGALTDTITTTLKTKPQDGDDIETKDYIVKQRLYVGKDGKLRYSKEAYDDNQAVWRMRGWNTPWHKAEPK